MDGSQEALRISDGGVRRRQAGFTGLTDPGQHLLCSEARAGPADHEAQKAVPPGSTQSSLI